MNRPIRDAVRRMTRQTVGPSTIEAFLAMQNGQDLLRFITCGSVDDGKSTLIGRLLWDAHQILDDQVAALRLDSRKYGTQGDEIDFALLVDGLAAEREQGITIDVAYRFFATAKRKFIVADTPGHEQYTRNMITGASTADLAILLVNARAGLLTQTRRHAYLASLMGIRHVVLAINKMDLVSFAPNVYREITEAFEEFAEPLGFETMSAIPICALKGDNITGRSANTPWYHGPTLMAYLETIEIPRRSGCKAVFPVQWVCRPNAEFRGYAGTLDQGTIKVGDEVRVTASGQTGRVTAIVTMDGNQESAGAGDAITLRLDRDVDVSRGDIVSLSHEPLGLTDQFEATVIWMGEDEGVAGRSYDLKLSTQWASASIANIKHRINVNTLAHEPSRQLRLNDICVCNVAVSRPVAFAGYREVPTLGSFILVDRYSHATVAAGLIHYSLRRSQNVHKQALSISRSDRERLNGHSGKVVWFTGLSGSGKSTLANALEVELHRRGLRTYILDGDNVRQGLNKDLGFTEADRVENIRRVSEVARLMMDAGLIVITAFISPFKRERETARELIGSSDFLEVYVSTSLEVCERRDVKGLYKKAREGKIPNMTGISSAYEVPEAPDFIANGTGDTIDRTAKHIAKLITGD